MYQMVVFLLFQYCFTISYRKDAQQRQYDLKADSDSECTAWIDAIRQARYFFTYCVPKTSCYSFIAHYRSCPVNSNTVKSKFHLIRTFVIILVSLHMLCNAKLDC